MLLFLRGWILQCFPYCQCFLQCKNSYANIFSCILFFKILQFYVEIQKPKMNLKIFSYYLFFLLIFSDSILSSSMLGNFWFLAELCFLKITDTIWWYFLPERILLFLRWVLKTTEDCFNSIYTWADLKLLTVKSLWRQNFFFQFSLIWRV